MAAIWHISSLFFTALLLVAIELCFLLILHQVYSILVLKILCFQTQLAILLSHEPLHGELSITCNDSIRTYHSSRILIYTVVAVSAALLVLFSYVRNR